MRGVQDTSALFGVAGHSEAAHRCYLGLHALQARGSDAAAIASSDGQFIHLATGLGPVERAIDGVALKNLSGQMAIGQAQRLPTTERTAEGGNPLFFGRYRGGQLTVAVSGRFTNGTRLRRELQERGALLRTAWESEVLAHLIAQSSMGTLVNRLVDALWRVQGAFSVLVLSEEHIVAVRDPHGLRPLVLGRLGDGWTFASEDTAIRQAGGTPEREMSPGEMCIVDGRRCQVVHPFGKRKAYRCVNELLALASPDARVHGEEVHSVRRGLGERLAVEHPAPSDAVVVGVPDSSELAAIGYARASSLPFEPALRATRGRDHGVLAPPSGPMNLMAGEWRCSRAVVEGREVVLVSALLASGARVRRGVRLLRDAGARRVHLRVASPLLRASCFYGVGMPAKDELAISRHRPEALAAVLDADSVGFLSDDGMADVLGRRQDEAPRFCLACFTDDFPVAPEEPDDQLPLF